MKLTNLSELYQIEKKKKEDEEERKRYLRKREIKGALDVGAQVVTVMKVKKDIGREEVRSKTRHEGKRVK